MGLNQFIKDVSEVCQKITVVVAVIGFCLLTVLPLAAGDAGQTAAEVLLFGSGAIHPAMGGAGVASVSGAPSLHYNPAGLAYGPQRDLKFTYQQIVEDIGYGNLDYNHNLVRGRLGGGLRYLSYGSLDRMELINKQLVKTGKFSDFDLVGTVGYGERIGSWAWGASVKLIHLNIDGTTANGRALDLGFQYHSPNPDLPISLGIMAANFGPGIEFGDRSEDLPFLTRGGVTVDFYTLLDVALRTHLDFEYLINSSELGLKLGMEYDLTDEVALRLGYDGNLGDIDNGLTAGFGFAFGENIGLDYAYIPYGVFGDLHQVAFNYRLGTPERPVADVAPPVMVEVDEVEEPEEEIYDWESRRAEAVEQFEAGNYGLAYEIFLEGYEYFPEDTNNLNWLGVTRQRQGNFEAAIEWFERVLEIEPGNDYARYALDQLAAP